MEYARIPKQKRGIKTKTKITRAAFRLFAEKGIHGTNSQEIAKKAGVSIGTFYFYFKNKKKLLLEMLEEYIDAHYQRIWMALNRLDSNGLDHESIKTAIKSIFDAYDISPDFHHQTHALKYSARDIRSIYERERDKLIEKIQYLIEKNRDRLTGINDPHATALLIQNTIENVALTAKFNPSDIEENRLIDSLSGMISRYVKNDRLE